MARACVPASARAAAACREDAGAALAVRFLDLGSAANGAAVRIRLPDRDLHAAAQAPARVLRAAVPARRDPRRASRSEGRPGLRHTARAIGLVGVRCTGIYRGRAGGGAGRSRALARSGTCRGEPTRRLLPGAPPRARSGGSVIGGGCCRALPKARARAFELAFRTAPVCTASRPQAAGIGRDNSFVKARSEEHTSELQSLAY